MSMPRRPNPEAPSFTFPAQDQTLLPYSAFPGPAWRPFTFYAPVQIMLPIAHTLPPPLPQNSINQHMRGNPYRHRLLPPPLSPQLVPVRPRPQPRLKEISRIDKFEIHHHNNSHQQQLAASEMSRWRGPDMPKERTKDARPAVRYFEIYGYRRLRINTYTLRLDNPQIRLASDSDFLQAMSSHGSAARDSSSHNDEQDRTNARTPASTSAAVPAAEKDQENADAFSDLMKIDSDESYDIVTDPSKNSPE